MKRICLCKFSKLVLSVYRRVIPVVRNINLFIIFCLIRVHSNGLRWKICVLLKAFLKVKHVTVADFSGILVFENFLEGPIQYLLVQSQQWRHQNNEPNMFKVNNKKTRMTLFTSFWCLLLNILDVVNAGSSNCRMFQIFKEVTF